MSYDREMPDYTSSPDTPNAAMRAKIASARLKGTEGAMSDPGEEGLLSAGIVEPRGLLNKAGGRRR